MAKNPFTKSEKCNENYLTRVVQIDNIREHPKADRLSITVIDGGNVIIAKGSVKEGDIMIYCPVESALSSEFLSINNQYEDKALNSNKNEKGFFGKRGRVRAINLREEPSRGFIFHPKWLKVWQPDLNLDNLENFVGTEFDYVGGRLFSKKYISQENKPRSTGGGGKSKKRDKKLVGFDRLIENQFHFHVDTPFLAKNLHKIDPEDVIHISAKWHGSSGISSNVIVNRELSWLDKLAKKLGVKVVNNEYGDVISSRGVIKNRYINKGVGDGYYKVDIWNEAHKQLKPFIAKGMTLYYEICGYVSGTTTFIQKNHDYGCQPGEFTLRIYRVTYTNPDGLVYEFTARQVQEWCQSMGLLPVKELYYGKAKDVYPDLDLSQHWHQNFLDRLRLDKDRFFMEMDEPDCVNEVPFEGLVIRKEGLDLSVFKLKTDRHYGIETQELDKGEIDIETQESLGEDSGTDGDNV